MGDAIKPGQDAHHIVPGGIARAERARKLLNKYQIDINDAVNGVGLDPSGHHGQGLHSNDSIDAVFRTLQKAIEGVDDWAAGRDNLLETLGKLADKISRGVVPT